MLGQKINEFDNSKGLVSDFDRIFFKNKLNGFRENEQVEILGIDNETESCLNRIVKVADSELTVSFDNYFYDNHEDYKQEKTRFKYMAKSLDGTILARGYTFEQLSEKLGVNVLTIKNRFKNPIGEFSNSKHKFNILRREI